MMNNLSFNHSAYYKIRNAGTQNNGTHNTAGTTVKRRNIPEYQRNTYVTSAEHHGTTEP